MLKLGIDGYECNECAVKPTDKIKDCYLYEFLFAYFACYISRKCQFDLKYFKSLLPAVVCLHDNTPFRVSLLKGVRFENEKTPVKLGLPWAALSWRISTRKLCI